MPKYQYPSLDMQVIAEEPEEFIIPECLEACKMLWSKNIETFMCSNEEDDNLYILVQNLSEKNLATMKNLVENSKCYYYDEFRKHYGISVKDKSREQVEKLSFLTEVFSIQDTIRFKTEEKFLSDYKHNGSPYYYDGAGAIHRDPNPELKDATLEEALKQEGKENLYIASEGRIYDDEFFLRWHKRYLEQVREKENIKIYELKDDVDKK